MQKLDQLFKVLSDNTRLRLLTLLAQRPHCVCEFQSILQAPQPTVSRHLAYLRRSGLVGVERHGKMVMYSLAKPDDPIQAILLRCVYACISEGGYFRNDIEQSKMTEPLIRPQGKKRRRSQSLSCGPAGSYSHALRHAERRLRVPNRPGTVPSYRPV